MMEMNIIVILSLLLCPVWCEGQPSEPGEGRNLTTTHGPPSSQNLTTVPADRTSLSPKANISMSVPQNATNTSPMPTTNNSTALPHVNISVVPSDNTGSSTEPTMENPGLQSTATSIPSIEVNDTTNNVTEYNTTEMSTASTSIVQAETTSVSSNINHLLVNSTVTDVYTSSNQNVNTTMATKAYHSSSSPLVTDDTSISVMYHQSGKSLALGITIPVLIILAVVGAVCVRRKCKKVPNSGRGYLTLEEDTPSFGSLQNPTYDLEL